MPTLIEAQKLAKERQELKSGLTKIINLITQKQREERIGIDGR